MKAFPVIAGLVIAGAIVSPALAQSAAKDATKPVQAGAKDAAKAVSVNGKAIPKSRVEFMVKSQTSQGKPDNEQLRKAIYDQVVAWELVAQEAERKGLSKSPDVQSQIDIARQQIIFQAYLQDYLKAHPIKDEALRAEYNKVKGQRGDKEYKARHILVETEDQAKGLISDLKKGAKFEDLAAKNSKDPGTKDRGGDLDWNVPSVFDKQFSDAMVKLDKGKFTDAPVHTRFGFHVIQLDDVRQTKFPALAEVKARIQQQLVQNRVGELIKGLRAKAKVE